MAFFQTIRGTYQTLAAIASLARFFSFLALLSSFRSKSSIVRSFLCFFDGESVFVSPFKAVCLLFSLLEGRLSSLGIPSPAVVCGGSSSSSEFPRVPASPLPNPVGLKRIFRPVNCGRGARMVDRVMEAAASEPVFWSACLDPSRGS
jgi:hypothetical protein